MDTARQQAPAKTRLRLNRERVLRGAVALADEHGIEALTMRSLGRQLGVEAMSLYNHVQNKEDVLDGMVEVVLDEIVAAAEEIEPPVEPSEWKAVARRRILAAREVLLRHRWAPAVFESRGKIPQAVPRYTDALLGLMLGAGFSIDLGHHALHALGSRAFGFSQELFVTADEDSGPGMSADEMAARYPHLAELARVVFHDADSTLGGCDDQFEFEFGLDLLLDGLDRLRLQST